MSFEEFWVRYAGCPKCKQTETNRLAASNAWYRRQGEIESLRTELSAAKEELKELRWFRDAINSYVIPGQSDTQDATFLLVQKLRDLLKEAKEMAEFYSDDTFTERWGYKDKKVHLDQGDKARAFLEKLKAGV